MGYNVEYFNSIKIIKTLVDGWTCGLGFSESEKFIPITLVATKWVEKGDYLIDVELFNDGDQTKDLIANGFGMLIEVVP